MSTSRVISYDQALSAAIHRFVADGRLDMQELADELAVGRATLYRVVGGRDRLLGDVLWSLADRTLQMAIDATTSSGIDRMVDIATHFKRSVADFDAMRAFLRAEPDVANRVLFTSAGGVHPRMVEAWKAIFEDAEASGELTLPFDAENLAYLWVRIGESMLYADLFAGRESDLELAAVVQRALLRFG